MSGLFCGPGGPPPEDEKKRRGDGEDPSIPRRRMPKKRKGGHHRGNHFMDVALTAYARYLTQRQWWNIEDGMETRGETGLQAALEAGDFLERVPFHRMWQDRWRQFCDRLADEPEGMPSMGAIEAVMREGVAEEQAARKEADAPLIEDTWDYKMFIQAQMDKLLEEASGEREEA